MFFFKRFKVFFDLFDLNANNHVQRFIMVSENSERKANQAAIRTLAKLYRKDGYTVQEDLKAENMIAYNTKNNYIIGNLSAREV